MSEQKVQLYKRARRRKPEQVVGLDPAVIKKLKQPEEAADFLNAALEVLQQDGDVTTFNLAIKHLLKFQNITKISRNTTITRQQLYRILAGTSKTNFENIVSILYSMGFKLEIKSAKIM